MLEGLLDLNQLITNAPYIFAFLFFPCAFLLIFAKDAVRLKIATHFGRTKGVKLRIRVTKDKNVRIETVKLDDESKIQDSTDTTSDGIEWEANRSYFAPQYGVQACFTGQGLNKILDPLGEGKVDLADGEVVDRMVKRAELMRDMGVGWFDTQEQKMLVLILAGIAVIAVLTLAGQAQVGEFIEVAQPILVGLAGTAARAAGQPL